MIQEPAKNDTRGQLTVLSLADSNEPHYSIACWTLHRSKFERMFRTELPEDKASSRDPSRDTFLGDSAAVGGGERRVSKLRWSVVAKDSSSCHIEYTVYTFYKTTKNIGFIQNERK
ncbi:hypothetical protein EDC96DRAFT_545319 [Choanephora cucurbitarum]|nr:hypothetical protein EDC96DRAFT_545319 [Choanephora cucurbitarum]